ncbi:MAG TPA: NAD(P)/FAD-dependent oxidoreductase [Solirubrobacteraceae bacterium]|nr:NAD(P)/FAD-dependent oxidoreductase [Solirubrobacteraceae bacterium]
MAQPDPQRRRVVVIGGGFGGLESVKALRHLPVDITLIDRNNYHLFQPLTYQVSTAALSPDEIAEPLRAIFRRDRNVRVLMAEVSGLDLDRRRVVLRPSVDGLGEDTVPYDTLVVAAGASYSYFGHEEWRPLALEVKTLDNALRVRSRILTAFEAAELEHDHDQRCRWLTFMVVGAGPTGVEMAGQIAELARDTLPGDFRAIDPRAGRVLLVEAADRVLPAFPPQLSERADRSLRELGVESLTGHTVVGVDPEFVRVRQAGGQTDDIPCRTIVWAAGVAASPLAAVLAEGSESDVDRAGRVTVEADLTLPGRPEVLAVGDMARVPEKPLPGLAPVAMQQGRYVGRLVADRLAGRTTPPFRYIDKGNLATIGRARAVADLRGLQVGGFLAWAIWLVVHLFYLVGFENRAVVLVRWAYNFFTRGRGGRLVTHA